MNRKSYRKPAHKNDYFIGVDEMANLRNATEIKHYLTGAEFKQAQELSELTIKKYNSAIGMSIMSNEKVSVATAIGFVDLDPLSTAYSKGFDFKYREKHNIHGMMVTLLGFLQECARRNRPLVFWGKREAMLFIKLFLEYSGIRDEEFWRNMASRAQNKISGKWSSKLGGWEVQPLIEVKVGNRYISIKNIIGNSSFSVVVRSEGASKPSNDICVIDASKFWDNEKIGDVLKSYDSDLLGDEDRVGYKEPREEFHKIDWKKFYDQFNFKWKGDEMKIDIKSIHGEYVQQKLMDLQYAAQAAKESYDRVINDFCDRFGYYPKDVYTPATLTTVALAIKLSVEERNYLSMEYLHKDWLKTHPKKVIEDVMHKTIEGYSGALIDGYAFGTFHICYLADITSSFPSIMAKCFYDLRGAKIYEPDNIEKFSDIKPYYKKGTYIIITAKTEDVRRDVWHSISTKTKVGQTRLGTTEHLQAGFIKTDYRQNVRVCGDFVATELYEAWEYLENQQPGAITKIKKVIVIETTGKKCSLSELVEEWFGLRINLKELGEGTQYTYKLLLNAIYGKLMEAHKKYEIYTEEQDRFVGHSFGHLFNPLYGMIVTSLSRLRLLETAHKIYKNGGTIIALMTDAVYYSAEKPLEAFPREFDSILYNYKGMEKNGWTEGKELGLFTKPERLTKGLFLKTGLYEFIDEKGKYKLKTMGTRVKTEKNETQVLRKALMITIGKGKTKVLDQETKQVTDQSIEITRRNIVGMGEILEGSAYYYQLGDIVDKPQELNVARTETKRVTNRMITARMLAEGYIETKTPESYDFDPRRPMSNLLEEYEANFKIPDYVMDEILNGKTKKVSKPKQEKKETSTEQQPKKEKVSKPKLDSEQLKSNNRKSAQSYKQVIKILSEQLNIPQKSSKEGVESGRGLGAPEMRKRLSDRGIKPLA